MPFSIKSTSITIRMSSTLTSLEKALVVSEEQDISSPPINLSSDGLGEILGGQRDIHSLFITFQEIAARGGENHIPRLGANSDAVDLNSIEVIRSYSSSLRENVLSTLYGRSNDLILPNVPTETVNLISGAIGDQGLQASLFNLVLAPGLNDNSLLSILASFAANPSMEQLILIPNVVMFAAIPLNNLSVPGTLYDIRHLLESVNSLLQITAVTMDTISFSSLTTQTETYLSTQLSNNIAQISHSAASHLENLLPVENIVSVTPTEVLSINTRQLLLASVIGVPWIVYALASSLSEPIVAMNDSNVLVISNNIDLVGSLFESLKNFLKK